MNHQEIMHQACLEADQNVKTHFTQGGPFGAVIVKDGEIIAGAHNTVLLDQDPTAHAEVNVIRKACKKLGTHDLSGCVLYTSCEPCPMCLSSIIWANIKTVYYANTSEDANAIGFRDDMIYRYIKNPKEHADTLNMKHLDNAEAIEAFKAFAKQNGEHIY